MSWDILLKINTGKEDREVVDCGNYTYNVAPMYQKAMGKTISDFNNMKCKDAISILEKGVKEMEENPDVYKKMNPENGWGDYEGSLDYLKNFLKECRQNPECIIEIC